MKQLLLYFLFFIFSTLILVQCGKLFPSGDKVISPRKMVSKKTSGTDADHVSTVTNDDADIKDEGKKDGDCFFDNPYLPYNILLKIKESYMLRPSVLFQHNVMITTKCEVKRNKRS